MASTSALQIISIATSLSAAGGIASLTIFSIPSLLALPGSRSLPQIRWLFSRGSHIYPTASFLSSAGFASLAFTTLPGQSSITQSVLKIATLQGGTIPNGYLAAAALCLSIAPVTAVMVPTNFALIAKNEEKGGARSEQSAKEQGQREEGAQKQRSRTAGESVSGQGQPNQFADLSGPQARTSMDTTDKEDQEIKELLENFGRLNLVRAVLMGAGGLVGLATALA